MDDLDDSNVDEVIQAAIALGKEAIRQYHLMEAEHFNDPSLWSRYNPDNFTMQNEPEHGAAADPSESRLTCGLRLSCPPAVFAELYKFLGFLS